MQSLFFTHTNIVCLASLELFDSEILGMTYLKHYTMFEMLVTLFLGPVIVVLVNSVAMKNSPSGIDSHQFNQLDLANTFEHTPLPQRGCLS